MQADQLALSPRALFLESVEADRRPARILTVGDRDATDGALFQYRGHSVADCTFSSDGRLFEKTELLRGDFDGLFCSHTLEHSHNPGLFLGRCFAELRAGGVLGIVVPPLKHAIVGGHVSLWNAGLLLYRLILAGFDCREAAVRSAGYDVAVVVRKRPAVLPALRHDNGDIEALAPFFPAGLPVFQGFDGRIEQHNWRLV